MEAEEKAKLFSEKYLNNCDVNFQIDQFKDRQLNTRGWQYKKYGNSSKGKDKLIYCQEHMNLVEDNSKGAKNDHNLRYYKKLIFMDENSVIEVNTSPSRSGNTCTYSFFTVTKV